MKIIKEYINILGVNIPVATEEQLHDRIRDILDTGKNGKVFTPNAEILLKASKSKEYRRLLNSADLLIPDGIGILRASRILGAPLPQRTAGIDTAEYILGIAAKKGLRVFLLGGRKEVAEAAAKRLSESFSSLCICGTHHGYFDKSKNSDENKKVIEAIKGSKADILFVCFGAPLQEIWISENADTLPALRLSIGLGGSLDVWSGNIGRAPRIVRKFGLEWLYRAIKDPKRIRRLPSLAGFLCAVRKQRRKNK